MELFIVDAEKYKEDAGACFGVVPKTIWSRYVTADEKNLITLSIRCLLVKEDDKLILFDTGIGTKHDEKFYFYLYIEEMETLIKNINKLGFTKNDITDVVFTHLHFDHVGGAVERNNDKLELTFPNANHWVSKQQWEWAANPNKREGASYFSDNLIPLHESGQLNFIDKNTQFTKNIELRLFNGHTDGQIIPFVRKDGKTYVYTADFIPSYAHIHIPFIPSFDTRPLISMKEKEEFLTEAVENNYILVFQHDIDTECCTVKFEKGKFKSDQKFAF